MHAVLGSGASRSAKGQDEEARHRMSRSSPTAIVGGYVDLIES